MEELIKEERLTGGIVVVARKGKVVHFGTYGKRDLENNLPVEKDTIFRIYSMTKAITSVAALILNEEGKINLDDPLSKYFPSLKEMKVLNKGELVEPNREATVADLLRHTSGLTYGRTTHKEINQAHKNAGILDREKKSGSNDEWYGQGTFAFSTRFGLGIRMFNRCAGWSRRGSFGNVP
jgi:CubicO group peptidase (beta-lactamase class C family)